MSNRFFPALQAASVGAALFLAWPAAAHSADQRILCPTTLAPNAVQGQAPPGWRFLMPQAAPLATAGMLHGRPEESAYLVPEESRYHKQADRTIWLQRWRFGQPHWYQTFVYCGYGGDHGQLQLFFPIAPETTLCTSTTTSSRSGTIERILFVCN